MDLFLKYRWIQVPTANNEIETIFGTFAADMEDIIKHFNGLTILNQEVKIAVLRFLRKMKSDIWTYSLQNSDEIQFRDAINLVEKQFRSIEMEFTINHIPMKLKSNREFLRDIIVQFINLAVKPGNPYRHSNANDNSAEVENVIRTELYEISSINESLFTVYNGQAWFAMFILDDLVFVCDND